MTLKKSENRCHRKR